MGSIRHSERPRHGAHHRQAHGKEDRSRQGKQLLADGGGLYLQVSGKGGRSWLFRYRWQGKRPEIGLGPYPAVTLAEARRRAELGRSALADLPPKDPLAVLKAEGEPTTFGEFSEQWLSSNLDDFRNAKHRQQWRNTLEAYAKPLKDQSIDAIDTSHVLEVLQPIWTTKRETARRVRGRIERILDAAKAKGLRTGENPARWRGHLKAILPDQKKPVQHHAAMPFEALPGFMAELRGRNALSARALEFLILTGTRSTEGRGALWSEIDLEARVWTIPGERMKANKAHRVPLSNAAMAVLEPLHELKSDDDIFVFPKMGGEGFVSEAAIRNLMGRMGAGEWTIHGFGARSGTGLESQRTLPATSPRWRLPIRWVTKLSGLTGAVMPWKSGGRLCRRGRITVTKASPPMSYASNDHER